MRTVRFRLTGDAVATQRVLSTLESLDKVDRVEEVADQGDHLRDDSSSAGLVDDVARTDFHDIEVHAQSEAAAESVRDQLMLAAREVGVGIEFVDAF
jgi:hypothetical protein